MKRIVYPRNDIRGQAIRQLVHRLENIEPEQPPHIMPDTSTIVERLQQRGCLLVTGNDVLYAPTWQVRHAVYEAMPTVAWGEKVVKKQKNTFRSLPGAIVRLPIEGSTDVVETFITDWSPFPAAAAIAVHHLHPFARDSGDDDSARFTSRFVRHPLTGDLLPVWVAKWVRPDFGTGAVVVNPAHSAVDLEFARQVGLPIRFALAELPITSNPSTWPTPPIIKRGVTTKTGRFDGLDVDRAMESYFEELAENGWATRVTDHTPGTIKIMTVGGTLEPVLEAVLSIDDSQPFELFWPANEVESSLLFARLLRLELYGHALEPQTLRLWHCADTPKTDDAEELGLASLAAGPIDQVGVIKSQILDQSRLFIKTHKELAVCDVEEPVTSALCDARRDLLNGNYHATFKALYSLQKQATRNDRKVPAAYFVLSYVLAGLPVPETLNLIESWQRMSSCQ